MTRETHNGMSADQLVGSVWRKSSHSGAQGNCVELTWPEGDRAAVRNSRDPHGPVLMYARADVAAFVAGVRQREV
ncbi:MAG TPA: DUF397 domain-containing protein [Actinophytocola sp.]|jgi:hypothetical protein|nr:DUF397 domain-containing protein [Actinophytocola sp.]